MENQTKFPYFTISSPKILMNDIIYSGYDLEEFLEKYDKKFFADYKIIMWINDFTFFHLGTLKEFTTLKRICTWQIIKSEDSNV